MYLSVLVKPYTELTVTDNAAAVVLALLIRRCVNCRFNCYKAANAAAIMLVTATSKAAVVLLLLLLLLCLLLLLSGLLLQRSPLTCFVFYIARHFPLLLPTLSHKVLTSSR
jgi:cytochrome b561